jgi:NADH dehydrogenase
LLAEGGFREGKVRDRGVGLFETDRFLACAGKTGYWAVGDNAGVPDAKNNGELCPPTAQYAIRQARTCAHNIVAAIDGRSPEPFEFTSMGMLASLGQRRAVADVMGMRLSGFAAWCLWRAFYLSTLPGAARRLRVALDWILDVFSPRDIAQIQPAKAGHLRVDHFEPGEIIINKHEIGRELFILKKGVVEVFQPAEEGKPETPITTLTRGAVFGERALIDDTPRTASVRAKTAVDVLVVSRADFTALVCQFPVLEDYFGKLMRERYPGELPHEESLGKALAECR